MEPRRLIEAACSVVTPMTFATAAGPVKALNMDRTVAIPQTVRFVVRIVKAKRTARFATRVR